jgi:hypothetical protein
MATPSSMIVRALQMLGGKTIGGTLTTAEETTYLAVLNAMMESWSLERLMCYQVVQESQALTASVGSLTIGAGATFNTTRPIKLVDPCFVRDTNSVDYPLELINAEAYGRITLKTIDGTYPQYLFYDAAYVAGLATIYLWPEPQAGLTLYINSWKQLQTFALISTTVVLPPGYQRAIESNLAVELAAGYRPVPPETMLIAKQSKAAIKGVNLPDTMMRLDAGVVSQRAGGYNIYTGF